MVQQVNKQFFHVTRPLPCNKFPALMTGQTVDVGKSHNPFFGFYEEVVQYPVTTPNGVMQVKAIKFLTSVRRGEVQSSDLPNIAHAIAEHYLILARELILEQVRMEVCPDAPSRQTCIWLADTLDEAKKWQIRLGGGSQIARLQASGVVHRVDAAFILGDSEPLSVTYERARSYWHCHVSTAPELETLFSGSMTVLELL